MTDGACHPPGGLQTNQHGGRDDIASLLAAAAADLKAEISQGSGGMYIIAAAAGGGAEKITIKRNWREISLACVSDVGRIANLTKVMAGTLTDKVRGDSTTTGIIRCIGVVLGNRSEHGVKHRSICGFYRTPAPLAAENTGPENMPFSCAAFTN
ncbi:hypothetical protein Bbelb_415440 [Branchiostoma belcheri]|nr:hypothetical protein Bbelb_415440 [Branchiostoma belcheri]